MSDQLQDHPDDDRTLPTRWFAAPSDAPVNRAEDSPTEPQATATPRLAPPPASIPLLLRQHFNNQIDLSAELAQRSPSLPLMSVLRLRSLETYHEVAALATADGLASVTVDIDSHGRGMELAFSFSAMLTLRFRLDHLSPIDRTSWLERMRHERDDTPFFLWSEARWERDYVVCSLHRRFANLYAFSQHGFEAVARLTPDVTEKLLAWMENLWKAEPPASDTPHLLTW